MVAFLKFIFQVWFEDCEWCKHVFHWDNFRVLWN